MRRKDKEIKDPREIAAILNQAQIIHLAMLDGDQPYIIPLNFGFAENTIYFHCARQGKKIDLIKKNNRVCFHTEVDVQVLNAARAHQCSTLYKSVIGHGKAIVIEDPKGKKQAADILMNHYVKEEGRKHAYGSCLKEVCMIKIEIESMTGKETRPEHRN